MTINPSTDPREAVVQARHLVDYALMHPSQFNAAEQLKLIDALAALCYLPETTDD